VTTSIGIGFSQDIDTKKAAEEAVLTALHQLGSQKSDCAIILSSIHYDAQETLPVINNILKKTKIIGCSTAGIILSDSIKTRGIAVLIISSEDIKFGIGSVSNINTQDMKQSGTILAQNCITDFGRHRRHAFLFFMDGYLRNNYLLLNGIQDIVGNVFPTVGAGSCDDFYFKNNFQIFKNRIYKNAAIGLMIGGETTIGVGGRHGWRPVGKPRIIDHASGNVIKTIDEKRASSLYLEYFGSQIRALKAGHLSQIAILYPLGVVVESGKEYLIRNVVDVMPDGSIVCQGDIPEKSEVHIMLGSKDACKQAAIDAANEAKQNLLGKQAKLIFIIECMTRLKLLGRKAFEEIEEIKSIFGHDVPIIGMYANGEICPFQSKAGITKSHYQNESIIVLAIT